MRNLKWEKSYLAVHVEIGVAAAATDRLMQGLLRLTVWYSLSNDCSQRDTQVA